MFGSQVRGPKLGETVIVFTPEPINGEDNHVAFVTKVFDERTIAVFVMPAFGGPLVMVGLHKRGVVNVLGTPSWDFPEVVDRAGRWARFWRIQRRGQNHARRSYSG